MTALNKATLVSNVAEKTGMTKAATERFISALQDEIITAVNEGNKVRLTGFAAFEPVSREAREMKSPKTGESVKVAGGRKVRIRPLKHFKSALAES